jgi:hypothetical protein
MLMAIGRQPGLHAWLALPVSSVHGGTMKRHHITPKKP